MIHFSLLNIEILQYVIEKNQRLPPESCFLIQQYSGGMECFCRMGLIFVRLIAIDGRLLSVSGQVNHVA